ncbi:biotin transporter BioY [Celeribacter indicus]|uniref:Biotin transporter n=1 Tax=Celeribacter indicus TaxID=1208324 RepID=A0A0B5DRN6_9RHOB|nr:biotin transporter BioY [Celeribacter indicus]AJE46188.1 BioY protein [Celeribacter indicus]SDW49437.1 biotin transport system substrate-specific component [Celeribacter indicus]
MTTRDIVLIALFAAITAVMAVFPPITLPLLPVPVTAQSLGVMLAGGVLGARRGGLAILLLLVLVAIGLPLLSGGRGGLAVFVGPTAGFLLGWVAAALAIGWMTERFWDGLSLVTATLICVAGGIVVMYAFGIPGVALAAGVPLSTAFAGSAAFIPGDIVKAVIAAAVMVAVKRSYPIIGQAA